MARTGTRTPTRRAVTVGLVAGTVAVYLAVTGIVERFNARNILTAADGKGLIQLSRVMLLLVLLVAGYLAARPREETPADAAGLGRGALAGGIVGGMVALFVLSIKGLNALEMDPSEILVAVRRVLLDEILFFGQGTAKGAALAVGVGAGIAILGAALHLLDRRNRRPFLVGLLTTLLVSMLEPLLRPMLGGLGIDTGWLFKRGGLTVTGAIVVFVVATVASALWSRRGDEVRQRVRRLPAQQRATLRTGGVALFILFLLVLPQLVGSFVSDVLGTVMLYVLLGLGLNIVVGYAGLLDLGYVAFFAVGAYATAVLTARSSVLVVETGRGVTGLQFAENGWTNFWFALPIVVVIAVVIGVAIGAPVLRLRGDYLAIVTLGFGEIIRTLVQSDWLDPWLGGAQGIIQIEKIPPEALVDLRKPQYIYYVILAFVLVAAFISYRLVDSRVGRAWAAMREDESVAEAMGISVIKYKLLAFAMGAGIGCLGGAFFAAKIGSVFPNSFQLLVSINVLAVIVLGGMGSIPGVMVGSLVLVGLPELLREFAEYRLLFYGAILVAIMVYKPEGLVPNVRRRRELHEVEEEEAQLERRAGEGTAAPVITAGGES